MSNKQRDPDYDDFCKAMLWKEPPEKVVADDTYYPNNLLAELKDHASSFGELRLLIGYVRSEAIRADQKHSVSKVNPQERQNACDELLEIVNDFEYTQFRQRLVKTD